MSMVQVITEWTVPMVRALHDDSKRYEVIDGELFVSPAPSWKHQDAVLMLTLLLAPYLREHRIGHVVIAPADVEYDERTVVDPDLFVVPLVAGRKPRTWEEAGSLLLAVEVLSPATARADRVVKRGLYQRHGVPEYWIVDVDARLVERWQAADERPEILSDSLTWHPDPAHPPLVMDLPTYFADVIGD